jgi:hypothetical protein
LRWQRRGNFWTQLEAANEKIGVSSKNAEDFEAAKSESDKIIAELTEKLNAIEAESLKTSRVSALVDKGVDKAEAESLVQTFEGITDEQFDALVSKLAEAPFHDKDEKKKKKDEEEAEGDGNMKKKYAEKAEEHDAEEAAEAAEEAEDAEALEDAEVEGCAALAARNEDESGEVVASLNQYFTEVLGGTNNEKES